jgi:uridine kinase
MNPVTVNGTTPHLQRLQITTNVGRMEDAIDRFVCRHKSQRRALLLGISGIDGSGKSRTAARVAAHLQTRGHAVALIGLDDWGQPKHVRFGGVDPGVHFYHHGFRWRELFDSLLEPLRVNRSVELRARLVDPVTDLSFEHTYSFAHVDVILLEGILLFTPQRRALFDLRWWIECSFETALQRARRRNQERLPDHELVADYNRIYFRAQRHHLEQDQPLAFIDGVLLND